MACIQQYNNNYVNVCCWLLVNCIVHVSKFDGVSFVGRDPFHFHRLHLITFQGLHLRLKSSQNLSFLCRYNGIKINIIILMHSFSHSKNQKYAVLGIQSCINRLHCVYIFVLLCDPSYACADCSTAVVGFLCKNNFVSTLCIYMQH